MSSKFGAFNFLLQDIPVKMVACVSGREPMIMPVPVKKVIRVLIVRKGTMHVLHNHSLV